MSDRFKIIEGGNAPKKFRRPFGQRQLWTCPVCSNDIGLESSAVVDVRLSPTTDGKKIIGGQRASVCAFCLARGKVTIASS